MKEELRFIEAKGDRNSNTRLPKELRQEVIKLVKQFAKDHNAVWSSSYHGEYYYVRLWSEYARMKFIGLHPNFLSHIDEFEELLKQKYENEFFTLSIKGSRVTIYFNY